MTINEIHRLLAVAPDLTLNRYAQTRNDRLVELAEKVAQAVLSHSDIAHSLHSRQIKLKGVNPKFLQSKDLNAENREWRRGDSNPRPETLQDKHLHA